MRPCIFFGLEGPITIIRKKNCAEKCHTASLYDIIQKCPFFSTKKNAEKFGKIAAQRVTLIIHAPLSY